MARHISYKTDNGVKKVVMVHSSDASKTFWSNLISDLSFMTITEEQFKKIKYHLDAHIDSNDNVDTLISDGAYDITKAEVQDELIKYIKRVKYHIKNHNPSLLSQSDLDTLNNINLNNITWPVNVQYKKGWIEALELNSITIDHYFEI